MTQFKVESRSPVNVFCEILSKTKTPFCTGKTGILINNKHVTLATKEETSRDVAMRVF